jgi:Family of unknown function (DUF5677)
MESDSFPPRDGVEKYRADMRRFMPPVFDAVEAQLRHFTDLLDRSNPVPRTLYERALFAQFARAADTARGVVTLSDHGHGELALGAARLSFELTVSAYWMSLDPQPRAQQYHDFMACEDIKLNELYTTLGIPVPRSPDEVRTMVEQKQPIAAGFEEPWRGWTQQTLHQRCVAVAERVREPAALTRLPRFELLATTLGNRGAHAGPRDAAQRLKVEGGFVALFGAHALTPAYSAFALHLVAWSFGCLGYLLAKDLDAADPDEWHSFFVPLIEKCGEVTSVSW